MAKTNYHEHFVRTKTQMKALRKQEKERLKTQRIEQEISRKYMKREARQRRELRKRTAKYFALNHK